VYSFGASSNQPRLQFRSEQTWTDDSALALGFMVAISSMTDSLYNSNRVLNAETLMMMKEHIGDTYGDIRYTLGNGCSGGSINQLTAASIYPGLLDGIQPTCTYPDSQSTALEVGDCERLVRFYVKPEWAALVAGLTPAQINAKKAAINGHKDQTGCHAWFNTFAFVDRPGNFLPEAVINSTTGRHRLHERHAAQQLPAAARARLGPGHQPDRNPLQRAGLRGLGLGHLRRQQSRAGHARQRRRAVRPEGAHLGRHHTRGVRRAEREDRRLRRGPQSHCDPFHRRPRRDPDRLPGRHSVRRQASRRDAHDRPQGL
jgi:hypothetical protein